MLDTVCQNRKAAAAANHLQQGWIKYQNSRDYLGRPTVNSRHYLGRPTVLIVWNPRAASQQDAPAPLQDAAAPTAYYSWHGNILDVDLMSQRHAFSISI